MLTTLRDSSPDSLEAIRQEMALRRTAEVFLLFSLGSQFDHLIAMKLAKLGVYCLVADPVSVTATDVAKIQPKGIILSGGPASAHAEVPPFDQDIFDLGIPVLGICLGFQLWAHRVKAMVAAATRREFGVHELEIIDPQELFEGLPRTMPVMESHGDWVSIPGDVQILAKTENAHVAAARQEHLWGVQFHPEVSETTFGDQILDNFCFRICGASDRYPAHDVASTKVEQLRRIIGSQRVLLALSGGSDSSVVAYLLREAMSTGGRNCLKAVYIKGIDRPEDEDHVRQYFGACSWLDLEVHDATDEFLAAFRGITGMASKRRAMKGVYRRILQYYIDVHQVDLFAQGTLYTDISESGGGYQTGARKAVIKEHHNVGLQLSVPELTPLDDCVKDNARDIGRALAVPEVLLTRHPFPGPGLILRIVGEITAEKLSIARQADGIWIQELRCNGLYQSVWQAGAVVTDLLVPCSKGDDAVQGRVIVLWAVTSVNGFTAQAADLPTDFIRMVDRRLCNEIREVGATVYRYTGKPPATIEFG